MFLASHVVFLVVVTLSLNSAEPNVTSHFQGRLTVPISHVMYDHGHHDVSVSLEPPRTERLVRMADPNGLRQRDH